jgi:hypothetical protein
MDEEQYKTVYNKLNPNRCIFEKSITNRRCDCQLKRKFVIATRECVACQSEVAMSRCTHVLDSMRNNARFSLKVVTINGPMPHNKELQVQAGGMLALQNLMTMMPDLELKSVVNIHQTMESALEKYGDAENLPYGELVKGIVKYEARPKRKKKK